MRQRARRRVRRGRWTGAAADEAYARLAGLPVQTVDDLVHLDRGWELSRRYDNHPVHDMLYAAGAEAARTELITADQTLQRRLGSLGWVRAPG
jgi:predicted nucleic acid-binding protein